MDVYSAAEITARGMQSLDEKNRPVVTLLSIDVIDRFAWEDPPEVEFNRKHPRKKGRATLTLVKG